MKYTLKDMYKTLKPANPWFNMFLFNPLVMRILWIISNYTKLTPNFITIVSLIFAVISIYFFIVGDFILGGLMYIFSFFADTIDGKLARIRNISSKYGAFLDTYIGTWVDSFVPFSICLGSFFMTNNIKWLIICPIILFLIRLHVWEGTMVSKLMGNKYREIFVTQDSSKSKNILSKIKNILLKHKLLEPFNPLDATILMFGVAPMTPWLWEITIASLIILILKAIFWFYYYSKILINAGADNTYKDI